MRVTQKGVRTIIEASLERADGIGTSLQNLASLTVHLNCRKNYTRKTSIESSKRQRKGS